MTNPTPERIAAALALAEAVDEWSGAVSFVVGSSEPTKPLHAAVCETLSAYRATAPKPLRTRAEVDAEIALRCRNRARDSEGMFHVIQGSSCSRDIGALIREPLAPDPTETGACPPECPACDPNHTRVIRPPAYGPSSVDSAVPPPEPAAGATLYCRGCGAATFEPHRPDCSEFSYDEAKAAEEPEACSCEESEALKQALSEAVKTNTAQSDKLTECRRLLRAIHGFAKSITVLSAEVP
jgi:hypothetical protein